ncbi:hypothetical protein ACFV4N_10395 [Actinosynnema sp. NPDC059797]
MLRKTVLAAVATAAAALTLPGVASADPVFTAPERCARISDLAGPDFHVRQCGVSDVDQFRAGFAGNGNSHCGPASLYNVLHYWGHQEDAPVGWLTTKVGNLNPTDPAHYNVVTNSIGRIATDAGWSHEDGTNTTNLRAAWNVATAPARNSGWFVDSGYVNSHSAADFAGDLARKLDWGPLQLVYGRYADGPSDSLKRTGGHLVTVVSAKGSFNGDVVELKLADPGRAPDHGQGDYLATQSAYEALDVKLERVNFKQYVPSKDDPSTPVNEALLPGTYKDVERWELTGPRYVSDTTRQMVEGFNWFVMAPPIG